jgi:hypothetical protein
MTSFSDNNQADAALFLTKHLPRHGLFSLATVCEDGQPWNVCLNLSWDHGLGIIWKSRADTLHSGNIRRDSRVAICIFSSVAGEGDFGLYIIAEAREVTDPDELRALLHLRYTARSQPAPDVTAFLGASPDRIYLARPQEAYLSDDRHTKLRLNLEVVRQAFKQA